MLYFVDLTSKTNYFWKDDTPQQIETKRMIIQISLPPSENPECWAKGSVTTASIFLRVFQRREKMQLFEAPP